MTRRALVTGGTSPIGAAIVRRLAADGCHVIVHAFRSGEAADVLAAEVGGRAVAFDVRDAAASKATIDGLLTDGPIQIVVHNAGTHDDVPLAGMAPARWREVLAVSLDGFFHTVQPLLLPMLGTRWGRIVAMSSLSGTMGNRGQANYAAAKAGLIGAVKSLSLESAKRGVTVNAVAPGLIASPAIDKVMTKERIAALVPAGRAGQPEEVADLVGFLVSDRAAYITGQVISINGGIA
ncbi:MAG: 3-oxoacyl-ACP reductase FabG [Geminicoccaceae bacterium]